MKFPPRARWPALAPLALAAGASAAFAALLRLGVPEPAAAALALAALLPPAGGPAGVLPAAGLAGWYFCLAAFLGDPELGFWGCALGFAVGAAAARVAAPPPRGAGLLVAGAAGFLGLALLRFLGLNASQAERLSRPLLGAADAALLLQPALVLALAAWGYCADAASGTRGRRALSALAGTTLAAALAVWLGAAPAFLLADAALALYGAARLRRALEPRRAPLQAAGSAVLACAVLGWASRDFAADTWRARLADAYPGGDFLWLRQSGSDALGVYRFSTGQRVRLHRGALQMRDDAGARRALLLAAHARDVPGEAALILPDHPALLAAADALGLETWWVDSHPGALAAMKASAETEGWVPPARVRGPFARLPGGPPLSVIFVAPPAPVDGAEARALLSWPRLRLWRRRLSPGGVLAFVLPKDAPAPARRRAERAVARAFAFAGRLETPTFTLVLGSDRLFDPRGMPAANEGGVRWMRLDPALAIDSRDFRWTAPL